MLFSQHQTTKYRLQITEYRLQTVKKQSLSVPFTQAAGIPSARFKISYSDSKQVKAPRLKIKPTAGSAAPRRRRGKRAEYIFIFYEIPSFPVRLISSSRSAARFAPFPRKGARRCLRSVWS